MSLAHGTDGAASAGTTSCMPSFPAAISAGDILVLCVSSKYAFPNTPSGWTAPANSQWNGGAGANGVDSGTAYASIFIRIADGTESGTVTVSVSGGNAVQAGIARFTITGPGVLDYACSGGGDNTAGTAWSVTCAANMGVRAGDVLVQCSAINSDAQTFTGAAFAVTGVVMGAATAPFLTGTTQGDDLGFVVTQHAVATGLGTAAPVYTMTANGTSGNQPAGATSVLRLRQRGIGPLAGGTAAVGTTSVAPAIPAGSVGDLLVLHVANKYPTNGPSTPSGWAAPTNNQWSGGSGSAGPDSGTVYATMFVRVADGTEGATVTVSIPSGNSAVASVTRYYNDYGEWDFACTGGADNSGGVAWSVTGAANPGLQGGDLVIVTSAANTDLRTFTNGAVAETGVTFGVVGNPTATATTNGDDCFLVATYHEAVSGTGSAAPVYTMTASGSSANEPTGASTIMRIRGLVGGTLSASGTSTMTGVGASFAQAEAAMVGTSTMTGVGASFAQATASMTGASTMTGVGASFAQAEASMVGTSTMTGVGASLLAGTAVMVGTSVFIGLGENAAGGGSAFYWPMLMDDDEVYRRR